MCAGELGWYCSNRSKGTKCDFLSSLFMGLVAEPSCHMWHISYMFAVGSLIQYITLLIFIFFNILYIHTHPHVCTRTSVWVHWNIALDVPICVAVYFLSIATFSITSSVQDFVLFLTDKKNYYYFFFWNSQGFIQPFHSFPPRHMRPFFTPKTDCFNSPDFCLLLSHELAIPSV